MQKASVTPWGRRAGHPRCSPLSATNTRGSHGRFGTGRGGGGSNRLSAAMHLCVSASPRARVAMYRRLQGGLAASNAKRQWREARVDQQSSLPPPPALPGSAISLAGQRRLPDPLGGTGSDVAHAPPPRRCYLPLRPTLFPSVPRERLGENIGRRASPPAEKLPPRRRRGAGPSHSCCVTG